MNNIKWDNLDTGKISKIDSIFLSIKNNQWIKI